MFVSAELTGRNLEEVTIGTNISVAAGATVIVQEAADLSKYEEISMDAKETTNTSHTFEIHIQFLHQDGSTGATATTNADGYFTRSVTSWLAGFGRIKVVRGKVRFRIKNSDTVSRVYNATRYNWPR